MPRKSNTRQQSQIEMACPSCRSIDLQESIVREQIAIGEGGDFFEVEVPVISCGSCNFQFTDQRAEKLRHAAACRHHGLLMPAEIADIRHSLGMTRAEFDAAFGIPPASMERWENGKLIQNRSMDSLLRALRNPATAARLDRREKRAKSEAGNVLRFPMLAKTNRLKEARLLAESFQLRVPD
jgi:putative zinc finger/helix-turn-helix YgiT family protein